MNADFIQQDPLQIYQLTIAGQINSRLVAWLDHLVIEAHHCEDLENTVVKVAVPDQAALRGILNKIWDLNLTLLAVSRLGE